ncbi:GNAT family N-acetyltransferase [Rhodoblastus acidophilus]|uniref:GNAT family N-acetyltransferase n=1 Tax=Candidatus Rhodoblastus alkanivorans TaxID=2954117 RepID=A0ABS9ZAZ5_9HYPH|nr:GNAT family N-acetyltransferase [Candidatus Rhodoblastus alkanivorans]MCI4677851.1 GNAT family N-acetyltransferase [Candidatus Rhodoblastus alkanivorans]MCI4684650.1 GNAT family N-acetyltransferase [Candidatus Rhodoblastus alkanivorans]MDI4641972.1 GNAT family N-acetyltransferase [Rhodoblastus acidophilus]
MSLSLRPYGEADWPGLLALWVETWSRTRPGIDFAARAPWLAELFANSLAQGAHIVVAEDEEGPAGFVLFDPARGWLEQIAVAARSLGSGAAQALIGGAKQGCPTGLGLEVNADNFRALAFYRREGFRRVAEGRNPLSGLPTLILCWRPLSQHDAHRLETPPAMTLHANPLASSEKGRIVVPPTVHPLENLLQLDARGLLDAMRDSQRRDFLAMVADIEAPQSQLHRLFAALRDQAPAGNPLHDIALFRPGALAGLFLDLHDHVMSHPVWLHPFFVRVFEGRATLDELRVFAVHYFNQIKNTRQCVAAAIGRFHGLMGLPYGPLNERVSEITQISLAQLVADEYGVGAHEVADYPPLGHLLLAKTHIAMYRQFFEGLGVPVEAQDAPMLPGVADNVLTQRLLAADKVFTPLEALASVGLGMEWGVPEFFSLLVGGFIRVAQREKLDLTPHHLEVFIAHVRYDILHAISVMLVTSLHMRGEDDILAVKGACNTLMASRYGMMTELYGKVFGEACPALADIDLEARYRLRDRRIEHALCAARRDIAPEAVIGAETWRASEKTPFVFA